MLIVAQVFIACLLRASCAPLSDLNWFNILTSMLLWFHAACKAVQDARCSAGRACAGTPCIQLCLINAHLRRLLVVAQVVLAPQSLAYSVA